MNICDMNPLTANCKTKMQSLVLIDYQAILSE